MKILIKIVKYAVLGVVGYLAAFAVLFWGSYAVLGDQKMARLLNFSEKPQMLVWLDSGEEFYQESTINVGDEKLFPGDVFSTEPVQSLTEADYVVFILEDSTSRPPQSILNQFKISEENINSALENGWVSRSDMKFRIELSLKPIQLTYKSVKLIHDQWFFDNYESDCHRDVIFTQIVAPEDVKDLFGACRL